MTNFLLGIDGGGSKTEAIVAKATGEVLGRGLSSGSNPHNCSSSQAVTNIITAINQALAEAGLDQSTQFQSACLGIAGLNSPAEVDQFKLSIQPRINTPHLSICTDGLIAFKSGTDAATGICLVASTGSICEGFGDTGDSIKAGNWGYLLGDLGSGFDIGQQILKTAVREFDGRDPSTKLLAAVLNHFGVDSLARLAQDIYHDALAVSKISGLSKLLSQPEWLQHPSLTPIADSAVKQLFQMFQAVAVRMNFDNDSRFPIVFAGKLFLAKDLITTPLISQISALYPLAQSLIPPHSPVYGAIKIAASKSLSSVSEADSLEI